MNATATLEQSANLILLVEKKSKRMYCISKFIEMDKNIDLTLKKISMYTDN